MHSAQGDVLEVVRSFALDQPLTQPLRTTAWVEEAGQQGVLPVCTDVLFRSGYELDDEMARARLLGAAAQLRTAADLGPLSRRLDEAGVRWVVVKGPVLAMTYRRKNLRSYGDLDLLVHPHDLPLVLDLLPDFGADLLDRNWQHIATSGQSEITWRLPHGTLLDLHWHLVNQPVIRARLGQRPAEILERRVRVTLSDVGAWSLDPVDVVVHTAQHACLSGGHLLKWLLDVQQALRWAQPEPTLLHERARESNLGLALSVILDRTAQYVDPDVHDWASPRPIGRTYRQLARAVSRALPPSAGRNGYSGRAAYASTRDTTWGSAQALLQQLGRNVARGSARRNENRSTEILRRQLGGTDERRQWLALAARYG